MATNRFKIGFSNVNGITNKVAGVAEFFRNEQLDILILVETWLRPGTARAPLLGVVLDERVVVNEAEGYRTGRRAREGLLVVANDSLRRDISIVHVSTLKRWVILKVRDLHIVACYFPPSASNSEISEMVDHVLGHPNIHIDRLVFVGDFNARMGVFTGDRFQNDRGRWFRPNVLEAAGLKVVKPVRGCLTSRARTRTRSGGGVTDLVLCSETSFCDITDLVVHPHPIEDSDHMPLSWAISSHSRPALPVIRRWNIARLRQDSYRTNYTQSLQHTFFALFRSLIELRQQLDLDPSTVGSRERAQVTVNNMSQLIKSWIEHSCRTSIGHATFDVRESRTDFSTDEIEELRTVLRHTCTTVDSTDLSPEEYAVAYDNLVEVRSHYKQVCRDRRNQLFDDFVQEMAQKGNYGMFMKRVSAMKARDTRSTCQLDPNRLDEYAQYFDSTFGARPQGKRTQPTRPKPRPAECDVDCTDDNIAAIMDKYFANGKSPGPDQIPAELLKQDTGLMSQALAILFSTCYQYAVIPTAWCKANVVPIFKKKGDVNDIANYRPISLTCVMRRVYERVIMQKLGPMTEQFLEPSQGGFREHRSTLHQCYALHEIMLAHPKAVHVFLDLKAAYDCVNRNILWRDMIKYGVPGHMVLVCQSLFDSNVSNLVVNGHTSRDITCRRGLLQGSSLSPLLFNVYINALVLRLAPLPTLTTAQVCTNNLFFADDAAIHAGGAKRAQRLLNACSKWADRYGMQFSAPKSAVLGTRLPRAPLTVQGADIPVAESFVYLGVEAVARRGLIFDKKQKARCDALLTAARFMKGKGMNALGWRANTRVLAYKAFLRPIMEYGLQFMPPGCKTIDYMELTQSKVLNMMLSVSRSTSRGAMLKLLQLETIDFRRQKLQFRFFDALNNTEVHEAIAWRIWNGTCNTRHKSDMANMALANPLYAYAIHHNAEETIKFTLGARLASMQAGDKIENGQANVAASIATPPRLGLSAYTDPRFPREDQNVLSRLRLGGLTFHQRCKQCLAPVSRSHAWQCSGELNRLVHTYPDEYAAFSARQNTAGWSFPDYLCNAMDKALSTKPIDQARGDGLFQALAQAATVIRDTVSGFERTEDGRSWFHPALVPKHRRVVHRPATAAQLARRAIVRQFRRPPGRPRVRHAAISN